MKTRYARHSHCLHCTHSCVRRLRLQLLSDLLKKKMGRRTFPAEEDTTIVCSFVYTVPRGCSSKKLWRGQFFPCPIILYACATKPAVSSNSGLGTLHHSQHLGAICAILPEQRPIRPLAKRRPRSTGHVCEQTDGWTQGDSGGVSPLCH